MKRDSSNLSANAAPFFAPGQAEAATALQKELLESYE